MTHLVDFKTKKALREAIASDPATVWIRDPSIISPRSLYASDIRAGDTIFCTNDRRSWFAQIARSRTAPQKLIVR